MPSGSARRDRLTWSAAASDMPMRTSPAIRGPKVREILEDAFSVPVVVDNDVNMAAIGEAYLGAGKDQRDFLCLTYGTGIGGAIVQDRQIFRGSSFSAGEFGRS